MKIIWWLADELGLSFRQKFQLLDFIKKEYHRIIPTVPFFPGTIETLTKLKEQYAIALNTSSSRKELIDRFQNRMEFLELFKEEGIELIVTRSDVKNLKPAPDSIYLLTQKLNLSPDHCIMVGDMEMDIQCGKRAKAKTIAILTGFLTEETIEKQNIHPDYTFKDITAILENINHIIPPNS